MPLKFKIPGYVGNLLLLGLGLVVVGTGSPLIGALLGALATLNLFLVYKLDRFSQEDVWLAHQIKIAEMRKQLIATQAEAAAMDARARPPSIAPSAPP